MKDGGSWYAYCGNDPVNRIDPSGYSAAYISSLIDKMINLQSSYKQGNTNAHDDANSLRNKIKNTIEYKENWYGYKGIIDSIIDKDSYKTGNTKSELTPQNVGATLEEYHAALKEIKTRKYLPDHSIAGSGNTYVLFAKNVYLTPEGMMFIVKKYIEKCDEMMKSQDQNKAIGLKRDILSFEGSGINEIMGLATGIDEFAIDGSEDGVDHLKDIEILSGRLTKYLDKISL